MNYLFLVLLILLIQSSSPNENSNLSSSLTLDRNSNSYLTSNITAKNSTGDTKLRAQQFKNFDDFTKGAAVGYIRNSFHRRYYYVPSNWRYEGSTDFGENVCRAKVAQKETYTAYQLIALKDTYSPSDQLNESDINWNMTEKDNYFHRNNNVTIYWKCENNEYCCPISRTLEYECCHRANSRTSNWEFRIMSNDLENWIFSMSERRDNKNNNNNKYNSSNNRNGSYWSIVIFIFILIAIGLFGGLIAKTLQNDGRAKTGASIPAQVVLPPPTTGDGPPLVYQTSNGAVAYVPVYISQPGTYPGYATQGQTTQPYPMAYPRDPVQQLHTLTAPVQSMHPHMPPPSYEEVKS